jgi:hypothetical protein
MAADNDRRIVQALHRHGGLSAGQLTQVKDYRSAGYGSICQMLLHKKWLGFSRIRYAFHQAGIDLQQTEPLRLEATPADGNANAINKIVIIASSVIVFCAACYEEKLFAVISAVFIASLILLCASHVLALSRRYAMWHGQPLQGKALKLYAKFMQRHDFPVFSLVFPLSNVGSVEHFVRHWVWPDYPADKIDALFLLPLKDGVVLQSCRDHGVDHLGRIVQADLDGNQADVLAATAGLMQGCYVAVINIRHPLPAHGLSYTASAFALLPSGETKLHVYRASDVPPVTYHHVASLRQKECRHASKKMGSWLCGLFEEHVYPVSELHDTRLTAAHERRQGAYWLSSPFFENIFSRLTAIIMLWWLAAVAGALQGGSATIAKVITTSAIFIVFILANCLVYSVLLRRPLVPVSSTGATRS